MKNYRWGIIGLGKIADKFASTVNYLKGATLQSVASREKERAKAFAEKHKAIRYYDRYEDIVNDPDVDAVYIATPHSFHCEQTLLCLTHQKAVLCEKPMALSLQQVLRMVDAARQNNTFLMEAMWTRFLPSTTKTLELIDDGKIGSIKYVRADFGFHAPFNEEGRLYNIRLGGGSLLDIGIYTLFLCQLIMGEPDQIKAMATLAPSGADINCQAIFQYKDGRIAQMATVIDCQLPITAEIAGTEGIIYLHNPWYKTESLTLHQKEKGPQHFKTSHEYNGFEYQVREVMECLEQGRTESSVMPLEFSITMSKVMDEIRRQCGIVYPTT